MADGPAPTDLEIRQGYASHDGEQIYWELVGAGADDDRPVVVLSHGAGGSHAIWYQQIPVLGRHFRTLTWDSRGFGNSTNIAKAPSPDAAAGDLAAVLDQTGITDAHLVGQSMGGWHIAAFATHHSQRVRSLVFADTVGALWTDELRAAMRTFQAAGGLTPSGLPRVGGHRALWPGTAQRDAAHAFLYQAIGSLHDPPMDQLGPTLAWTIEHEQVAALEVPVLFVAGTHDEIFPAPLLADSAALIPGATYIEITDAGHSPYFEQPEAWNEAVLGFLVGADSG